MDLASLAEISDIATSVELESERLGRLGCSPSLVAHLTPPLRNTRWSRYSKLLIIDSALGITVVRDRQSLKGWSIANRGNAKRSLDLQYLIGAKDKAEAKLLGDEVELFEVAIAWIER